MIFFEFRRNIQVIRGKAEGRLQAVWTQVSKRVDALETRAIGKMKRGHGIVKPPILMRLREIGQRDALQRLREDFSIRCGLLEHGKKSIYRITLSARGGQRLSMIGKQARKALARESVFIRLVLQCLG